MSQRVKHEIRADAKRGRPTKAALRRARIVLEELRTHGRDTRRHDDQFETGSRQKNARTVAALWWLYRNDARATRTLDRYKHYTAPLIFQLDEVPAGPPCLFQ